jgi:hypothetical protein
MTIYIITYRYYQEPGSGVVGAYATKEAAQKVLRILEDHGDMSKVFELVVTEDVEVEGAEQQEESNENSRLGKRERIPSGRGAPGRNRL